MSSKDLYICSTYFHVFIAIVKKIISKKYADIIIESVVPDNTNLIFHLKESNTFDNIFFFNRNIVPQYKSKSKIARLFFEHLVNKKLVQQKVSIDFHLYDHVYIFNDRTILGNHLIDIKRDYYLLEDGVDYFKDITRVNFREHIIADVERMLSTSPSIIQRIGRTLNFGYRTLGQSKYAISIEVNDKKDIFIPLDKVIEYPKKDLYRLLTKEDKEYIFNIFYSEELLKAFDNPQKRILILTQPLNTERMVTKLADQIEVYKDIITTYEIQGFNIFIKPHPRDTMDYKTLFPQVNMINKNFPIEIINFRKEIHFDAALTITSSAIYGIEFADKLIFLGAEFLVKYNNKENKEVNIDEELNESFDFEKVQPVFTHDYIPIVLSSSNEYCPYLAVVIQSILENGALNKNYDFIILNKNISEQNKNILNKMVKNYNNVSLRFFNVEIYFKKYSLFTKVYLKVETWFRLVIPYIMEDYSKVVYLDTDMVVNTDISELYDIDLGSCLLGASKCPTSAGSYIDTKSKKDYVDNVLKLERPFEYFQAGTIVFNLKEIRKNYKFRELMELASSRKWELLDQDMLNVLCHGRVKFIDMAWNVLVYCKGRKKSIIMAPLDIQYEYMNAREFPYVVHYAGQQKPWNAPMLDMFEYFWKYARNTPYYEIILSILTDSRVSARVKRFEVQIKSMQIKLIQKLKKKNLKEKIKILANKIFPKNTARRELIKIIFPRGSKYRAFFAKIVSFSKA